VHDSTIGLDRSLDDFIVVPEVDYDNFWLCIFAGLLTNADVGIRLKGLAGG
jgi:hypothetical protein